MFEPKDILKSLPKSPGVYIFYNQTDDIIYVGKAINLKNRVLSYFRESSLSDIKVKSIRTNAKRLEYIVVDSEVEALILECNLIKENNPRYNILLKDDKSYPYIKATLNEDFPRIFSTREYENDGAKYFGPYTSSYAVSETIEQLHKIWPLRTTNKKLIDGIENGRPCLNYHIGLCMAPCGLHIKKDEYMKIFNKALEFLNGKYENIIKDLEKEMTEASDNLEFEAAAGFRDKINAIKRLHEGQKVDKITTGDKDIIAFAKNNNYALFQIFFIRDGKMKGREHFNLERIENMSDSDIMSQFIIQFYSGTPYIPKELILEIQPSDIETISIWLNNIKGKKVFLFSPKKGENFKLVKMAKNNAIINIEQNNNIIRKKDAKTKGATEEIRKAIGIEKLDRIEAYDISNISGFENVGSMIVFEEGLPARREYRKFKIKNIKDDYASMQDMIYRRFLRFLSEKEDLFDNGKKFSKLPDILLVDGGIGHINAAEDVLNRINIQIPIAGMVKDNKHKTKGLIYKNKEVELNKDSEGFKIISRIQEEVHRFAIDYHKKLRQQKSTKSILDEIKGIGPAKRTSLMLHFQTIGKIKAATIEEIAKAPKMNLKSAKILYDFFRKKEDEENE